MRKLVVWCEHCGAEPSGSEFLVFHCLSFCSADCRDDYRTDDEARREAKHAAAALATVAEVMRRDSPAKPRRARAA